jgi:hypothetical protein
MSPQLPETMTLKKHLANSPVNLLEYRITARDPAVNLDEQLRIHVVNWGMESWCMSCRASPLDAVSWRYLGRDLATLHGRGIHYSYIWTAPVAHMLEILVFMVEQRPTDCAMESAAVVVLQKFAWAYRNCWTCWRNVCVRV